MAQVKAISSWPGVLHRAPDAKLILYPDAGHAFLFQEIEDVSTQIDLFLT